jgi:hypothetical protein
MKEGYDLSVGPFRRNGNFTFYSCFNTIVSRESVFFTFKAHVKLGTVLHEGWQWKSFVKRSATKIVAYSLTLM